MSKKLIYDAHVHVGGPWSKGTMKGLNSTFSETKKELIKSGVSGAVLITYDKIKNLELLNQIRKDKGPLKFWFFWWLDLRDKDDFKKIHCYEETIDGLKIHPSIPLPRRITDKIYEKYFKWAQVQQIPVLIHCGQWQEIANYKFALKVAQKYPKVNFILAHMGGASSPLQIKAARELKRSKLKNVYFDIAGTAEFWSFEKCIKEILGPPYYIYGSDYPAQYPKVNIQLVESLKISPFLKKKIFSQNLLKLIKK